MTSVIAIDILEPSNLRVVCGVATTSGVREEWDLTDAAQQMGIELHPGGQCYAAMVMTGQLLGMVREADYCVVSRKALSLGNGGSGHLMVLGAIISELAAAGIQTEVVGRNKAVRLAIGDLSRGSRDAIVAAARQAGESIGSYPVAMAYWVLQLAHKNLGVEL